MGSAEQGGNWPQRVLLVGGPKHGEHINLPQGVDGYEFTSSDMLTPYGSKPKWPEQRRVDYSTHWYRRDNRLSTALCREVFTHDVLRADAGGGFLVSSVDALVKLLEEKVESLKAASDLAQSQERIIQERVDDYAELQAENEALLRNMQGIRDVLENPILHLKAAVHLTGCDYESAYPDAD